MKLIKVLVVIGAFLLLSGMAFASLDTDLISYWSFDVDASDDHGSYDGSLIGNVFHNTSSSALGAGSYTFSGGHINITDAASGYQISLMGTNQRSTVSLWFNTPTPAQGSKSIMEQSDDLGNNDKRYHLWTADTTGLGYMQLRNNPADVYLATDKTGVSWYHMVIVLNGTEAILYKNGSLVANSSYTVAAVNKYLRIGAPAGTDATQFNGSIDDVAIWNRSLTASEVSNLWNVGAGCDYSCISSGGVTYVMNASPAEPTVNNSFNSLNVTFNTTINSSLDFNCSLYLDDILNLTIPGFSNGTTLVDFNVTFPDNSASEYGYFIECMNGDDGVNTTNTSFFVDVVNPGIVGFFFDNRSVYGINLTGNFNFSDTLALYSYNISVDGVQIDAASGLGVTSFHYNLSYNASSLSIGVHNLSIEVADGHTARVLGGEYRVSDGLFNDYLKYEFYDGGFARIDTLDGSVFDTFTTKRELDRYTFDYLPYKDKEEYFFSVSSDMPISILTVPGSKYKEWLVMGDHWLDFYLPNEPGQMVSMERVNDFLVNVRVSGLSNPLNQQYSSIGDLNIVSQNYTFGTASMNLVYSSVISELETNAINLTINHSGLVTETIANLIWNGTSISSSNTSYSGYDVYSASFSLPLMNESQNISFYWNYTLVSASNESGTINGTQEVVIIGVDNCSTYSTIALNFTLINESNDNPVSGTLAGHFGVWSENEAYLRYINLTWGNGSEFRVCISPSSASYIFNAQLEYGATGFNTETYYFNNDTLNNITDYINLPLTDGATLVTLTVTDENDNKVEGAYITVLKYDLTTDTAVTSEVLRTDSDGQALGSFVLNTDWYKFIIVYEDRVVLSTSATRMLTTSRTFRVNLGSDYFTNYEVAKDTNCHLIGDNNTYTYTFTYTGGSSVGQGCLYIVREGVEGSLTINSTCNTGNSGVVTLGFTPASSGSYVYVGKSYVTIDGEDYVCGSPYSIGYGMRFKTFGIEGLFYTFLVVLVLTCVGIYSPVIALFLNLFGFIASMLLGIFYLSWPSAVLAFVILGGMAIYKYSGKG